MTRRWSVWGAAGLVLGAAVLGGCSESREASDTLPGASAPSTGSTAALEPLGPPDLPMPDEARTPDAAGAEAFVRYYIELINRTSDVMDAAPLREFSDGCRDCARIASAVSEDAEAGYRYMGGAINVTSAGDPLLQGFVAELALQADIAALEVRDASGASLADLATPAYADLSGGAALRWDSADSTWLMQALTLE